MSRPPKQRLHDALAEALQDPALPGMAPGFHDAYLTRWLTIAELAMTDERTGLVTVSATASGGDLPSWDRLGFLTKAIEQTLRAGT